MTHFASRADESYPALQIERARTDDCVVLKLHGELDISTAPELERQLLTFDNDGLRRLLIDLEHVEFMDSTGLALIVRAAQGAEAGGYQLHLRSGSRQVQRLFELTGLLDHFTFED